jgi:formate-dependent nitrite reductase membrane component NrfD
MNYFVADPEWGGWIIAYFYVGGVAAGSYFLALLIDWFGKPEDRPTAGIGYRLAFPLVLLCAAFLIADLGRPERFWHMMLKSEVAKAAWNAGFPWTSEGWALAVQTPILKWWSPMSAGSVMLGLFGACSAVSFASEVFGGVRGFRWLRNHWLHRVLQVVGCFAGFFLAAYTGTLLTATNQPMWSDTNWLSPLFLASAASTGLATIVLIAWWRKVGSPDARHRLERVEPVVLGLELAVFAAFAVSLGPDLRPVWETWSGKILLAGTLAVGVAAPLLFYVAARSRPWAVPVGASCVLLGGFLLRYGAVTTPGELLARGPAAAPAVAADGTPPGWLDGTALQAWFAPEQTRKPGQPGADPDNRSGPTVTPRSKLPRVAPPEETSAP